MTIRDVTHDGSKKGVAMPECPLCGEKFEPADHRPQHFLTEHDPGEFGLEGDS